MENTLKFIGEIKTPYSNISECPRNLIEDGENCTINIYPEFKEGLIGLKKDDYIMVLYWLDKGSRNILTQNSFETNETFGTFSFRSPHRPNPIGVAVIKIRDIDDSNIYVNGLDCLSGTKLLDIKPAILKESNLK